MEIKTSIFRDELKLDEEVIPITINLTRLSRSIEEIKGLLDTIGTLSSPDPTPETIDAGGHAVLTLMESLFGDETAWKILNHYDDDYVTMVMDIFPYIVEVIVPQIARTHETEMDKRKRFKK